MIDHFMDHFIEGAVAVIFGIYIINMTCETFLGFSPIEAIQSFIAKITGKKDED